MCCEHLVRPVCYPEGALVADATISRTRCRKAPVARCALTQVWEEEVVSVGARAGTVHHEVPVGLAGDAAESTVSQSSFILYPEPASACTEAEECRFPQAVVVGQKEGLKGPG